MKGSRAVMSLMISEARRRSDFLRAAESAELEISRRRWTAQQAALRRSSGAECAVRTRTANPREANPARRRHQVRTLSQAPAILDEVFKGDATGSDRLPRRDANKSSSGRWGARGAAARIAQRVPRHAMPTVSPQAASSTSSERRCLASNNPTVFMVCPTYLDSIWMNGEASTSLRRRACFPSPSVTHRRVSRSDTATR